jgi:DNA repair protein RecO
LAKQGESNKILTLLTPNGRMSVILYRAHGSAKNKTELSAVAQPFCYADFQLQYGAKHISSEDSLMHVRDADIIENFYNLRLSIEKLEIATQICRLAERTSMPNTDCTAPLRLLLNTLHIIENVVPNPPDTTQLTLIEAIFRLRYMCEIGYMFDPASFAAQNKNILPPGGTNEPEPAEKTQTGGASERGMQDALTHIVSCPISRLYNVKSSPATTLSLSRLAEYFVKKTCNL